MLKDQLSEFKPFNYYKEIISISDGKDSLPITVEIDPTNYCNMSCIWCNDRKKLPQAYLKKEILLKLIKELKELNIKSLVIKGGGEPLLYPHVFEIFSLCRNLEFPVGLITNGSLLTDKIAEIAGVSCRWIRISVDAGNDEIYQEIHRPKEKRATFERLLSNIKNLCKIKDKRCTVGCNYVIHKRNFLGLLSLIKILKRIGVSYINIRPPALFEDKLNLTDWNTIDSIIIEASTMNEKNFRVISKYKKRDGNNYYLKKEWKRCRATPLIGNIGADGEVYVCCSLKGLKDFSFGNIYKNSFAEIWTSKRRQEILKKINGKICQKFCSDRLDRYNKILEYFSGEKENCEFL